MSLFVRGCFGISDGWIITARLDKMFEVSVSVFVSRLIWKSEKQSGSLCQYLH